MYYIVKLADDKQYSMIDVGSAIEKLIGFAYQSKYTQSEFRNKYADYCRSMKQKVNTLFH